MVVVVSEYSYYAGLSGLVPVQNYSLDDHKRKYFEGQSGLTPPQSFSLADHQIAAYAILVAGEPAGTSLPTYELLYFQPLSGRPVGLSIDDYKSTVFG